MPYYSWSYSGDPTFANVNQVMCVFDSGVQADVSEVSATFDAVTDTDGGTSMGILAHFYAAADTPPIVGTGIFTPAVSPDPGAVGTETPAYGANGHWPAAGGHVADPGSHERVQVYVYPRGGGGGAFPRDMHLVFSGAWGGGLDTNFCAYGGRLQPDVPKIVLLAPDILLGIVGLVTQGWAWTAVGIFAGQAINVEALCTTPRKADPGLTLADMADLLIVTYPATAIPAAAKAWQWLQWAAWPYFCECVPGTPTAVPFPPAISHPPDGAPPGPLVSYTCDLNDLCSQMQNLTLMFQAILQRLGLMDQMITLIQRQGVPFDYVHGVTHGPFTGTGTFAVSDILGLSVNFSVIDPSIGNIAGGPTEFYRLGELSFGTADGYLAREVLHHADQLVMPVSANATIVGYRLAVGCTATFTELLREP